MTWQNLFECPFQRNLPPVFSVMRQRDCHSSQTSNVYGGSFMELREGQTDVLGYGSQERTSVVTDGLVKLVMG